MTATALASAQADVRFAFRSASIGQIYAGLVWLASAAAWQLVGTVSGVIVLVVGGFFIYPVTLIVSRVLGNPGVVDRTNPLREASITIPLVGALGIPLAGVAALHEIQWFYPAFMVIMGAHYLPFSFLYGMPVFVALGGAMWLVGVVLAVWAPGAAVVGAWMTGLALVGVGIWAGRRYEDEFASSA